MYGLQREEGHRLTWDAATKKLASGGCAFESMNDSAFGEAGLRHAIDLGHALLRERTADGVQRSLVGRKFREKVASSLVLESRKPRLGGALAQADEGTRTLDLLHGKQTL
jgi:hypothetical protein